ncbi:MAG: D-tyrosyl-tRNA(Tyr) deacylase [Dehalococcoidia bacterium]|nr:MAG: D-tyrosyl-tRNA(Tyr) deacylase [Dehalococcoidia bacterium]
MKALLQRVSKASVTVEGQVVGHIGRGLVVFVGISRQDRERDAQYLAEKTVNLRLFSDREGKFNLSALDTRGDLLVVSQFTLLADAKKGRRPSFTEAAPPGEAEALFERFLAFLRTSGLKVETGRFQQHMLVEIHNEGPVTILLDSKDKYPEPRSP